METQTVEWKKEWKDELLKAVCGFANSKGGVISVGVDDDGTLVGVKDPKDVMKKKSDTVSNKLALCPEIEYDEDTGIITVTVEHSDIPVMYNGRYYVRTGNTVHEARGREYDKMVAKRGNISWLNTPMEGMDETVLDPAALDYFREKALEAEIVSKENLSIPNDELLQRLRLMVDGRITRAAILLFHPDPERYILGSNTKIGMFDGPELLYQDILGGPLITRTDRIMDLLRAKYQKRRIAYDGLTRVEVEQYPAEALRECVLNALMHNDYTSEIPIQIRVWEDKMMISDCGGLPEAWTMDDLLSLHVSHPANPTIANTFFMAGFVEGWGRGIERILNCYKERGEEPPEFKATAYTFSVILKNLDHNGKDQVREMRSDRPTAILRVLAENGAMSVDDIISALGSDASKNTMRRILKGLRENGMVAMTIPDRPNSRNQGYVITRAGIDELARRGG